MRLFADENLESAVIETLRRRGHDVAVLAPGRMGADDPEVLALATGEQRLFVTNDKDFAELAFLQRQLTEGIVLVRLPRFHSAAKARRVAEVIDEQAERLLGVFTVIEAAAIRRRPFLSLLR
jgi:predicted nuclease of predicted toxin-antitoxin system